MGMIYSPVKLVKLLMKSPAVAAELKQKDARRYFSKEGRAAYNAADTVVKKTAFFFEYLLTVAREPKNVGALHKIAYVMAEAMDRSSLECAGYPAILDAEKNPLVAYVKNNPMPTQAKYDLIYGAHLLCALHGVPKDKTLEYLESEHAPYKRMTPPSAEGEEADLYRVERLLVTAFCMASAQDVYVGPFNYSIVAPANTDDGEDA